MGGGRKQFQVLVNPDELLQVRRDAAKMSSRPSQRATPTPPAAISNDGGNELLVRSLGRIQDGRRAGERRRQSRTPSGRCCCGQVARVVEGAAGQARRRGRQRRSRP